MRGMRGQSGGGSRILGWVIFVIVIAGGPILSAIQSATGVRLPSWALAAIIGALMLVSAVSSIWNVARAGRAGDRGDATADDAAGAPINVPMPSFGEGGASIPRFGLPPSTTPPPTAAPLPADRIPAPPAGYSTTGQPTTPLPPPIELPKGVRTPSFEPIMSVPQILIALGVAVLVVGGLALILALP
jgi:hypothetical protein